MDICKHDTFCGGCKFQNLSYEEQLKLKEREVKKLIESKGLKISKTEDMEAAPDIYRYRNKMEYTFGDMEKDGPITLGMHQKGRFMSIVTVDECQLVSEDFNKILSATLEFVKSKGYSKYHKKTHKGLMRNLVIRLGEKTKELLINIVTQSVEREGEVFDSDGYRDMLLSLKLEASIVGILHTQNDNFSDAVKGEEVRIITGRDYYLERIMGLEFQVGAFSFFQTNISAVERLYTYAVSLIDDLSGKMVLDLFCGTGTISQSIARKAGKVIGIDIVEDAIKSARANTLRNSLENVEFVTGDVFEVMERNQYEPDVIFLDPPRKGLESKAIDKIISYGVEQIVYISCNPKTLIENLYYFEYNGYKIDRLKPFDNFPHTGHVETVCLLSKIYSNERQKR